MYTAYRGSGMLSSGLRGVVVSGVGSGTCMGSEIYDGVKRANVMWMVKSWTYHVTKGQKAKQTPGVAALNWAKESKRQI